jgi:hypothetical protein
VRNYTYCRLFSPTTDYLRKCWNSIFWDITPCSPLKVALLATCFMLVSCLTYSSTLKMAATCSSKKSVAVQRTTRRYIPEDKVFITTAVRTSNLTYVDMSFPWPRITSWGSAWVVDLTSWRMEVTDQMHIPAVFIPKKEPPLSNEQEAERPEESSWTWGAEKSCPYRESNTIRKYVFQT